MNKRLFLALIAILLIAGNASAQTLHVINFCNTLDPRIGCAEDYDRTIRESSLIGEFLGYGVSFYCGEGEDCSKDKLMGTLSSLACKKDDVILFYYSGHGTRSSQDKSEFPQMCLKYEGYEEENFVAVHTVVEELSKKDARFTLVVTDCCNNTAPGVSVKSLVSKDGGPISDEDMNAIARNYRKLFLENPGMVVVTSSKKGQTSAGGEGMGGLFSIQFFENSLYAAVTGVIPATWNDVLKDTYDGVKNISSHSDKIPLQEPYFEINMNNSSSGSNVPQPNPSINPTPVVAVESDFASDLATLLDISRSEDWRINQANNLANKYFTSDATVATVGRNGTTIIEYETARDFLRRIAVSQFIQKINVIKETTDSTGKKRNYIKIQEIRKSK